MEQDSVFVRKTKIHIIENEMFRLLSLIDLTTDLDLRLNLWWQIEECRYELEMQCGLDLPSKLLPPRASSAAG